MIAVAKLVENNVNSYPVPIFDIVNNNGLKIKYVDMQDSYQVEGVIDRERKIIFINKDLSQDIINKCVAHEFGHEMLDHRECDKHVLLSAKVNKKYTVRMIDKEGNRYCYDEDKILFRYTTLKNSHSAHEVEADYFAQHILIPGKMLADVLKSDKKYLSNIQALKELFFVPGSLMLKALEELQGS